MSSHPALRGYRALQARLTDIVFEYGETAAGDPQGDVIYLDIQRARRKLDRHMRDLMIAAGRVARASAGKYGAADLVRALDAFAAHAPKVVQAKRGKR